MRRPVLYAQAESSTSPASFSSSTKVPHCVDVQRRDGATSRHRSAVGAPTAARRRYGFLGFASSLPMATLKAKPIIDEIVVDGRSKTSVLVVAQSGATRSCWALRPLMSGAQEQDRVDAGRRAPSREPRTLDHGHRRSQLVNCRAAGRRGSECGVFEPSIVRQSPERTSRWTLHVFESGTETQEPRPPPAGRVSPTGTRRTVVSASGSKATNAIDGDARSERFGGLALGVSWSLLPRRAIVDEVGEDPGVAVQCIWPVPVPAPEMYSRTIRRACSRVDPASQEAALGCRAGRALHGSSAACRLRLALVGRLDVQVRRPPLDQLNRTRCFAH